MYQLFIKKFLDLIIALIAFALLSPIFVLVTIALYCANQGQPFFVQNRPGKNKKLFKIIKFKTMNDKKDDTGTLLSDAKRLTVIGKFVRKTSFDEIPQLINILRGEMSLVGPRPLLVDYLNYYSVVQNRRHDVQPGITGWAQINGRNTISWDKKFELDVWYVENISFKTDVIILIKTAYKVFKTQENSALGHATMPSFIDECKNKTKV